MIYTHYVVGLRKGVVRIHRVNIRKVEKQTDKRKKRPHVNAEQTETPLDIITPFAAAAPWKSTHGESFAEPLCHQIRQGPVETTLRFPCAMPCR